LVKFNTWEEKKAAYKDSPPEFEVNGNRIKISLSDNGYSCGVWKGVIEAPEVSPLWSISLAYDVKGKEDVTVMAAVQQCDKNNVELCGDNLTEKNGQCSLTLEPRPETAKVYISVLFSSVGGGTLEFEAPSLKYEERKPHRVANIATAFFNRRSEGSYDQNIPNILRIIDKAADSNADILCFTEAAYNRGGLVSGDERFISVEHPHIQLICDKAKERKIYLIFGLCENDGGLKYNTSLLISPEGKIIQKYRKTHLCFGERTAGIVPGDELPVFELPFAKVGILICWDMWFPEAARILSRKGAEIIFIPTAGNPECIYEARAYENGIFIAVSGLHENGSSCIINQYGDKVAAVYSEEEGFCMYKIDFDGREYKKYLSFENGYGANLYPADMRTDLYMKEESK